MDLVQIFLPLRHNDGSPFPVAQFQSVKKVLLEQFGGVTAFLRSPGEGVWEESPQNFVKDDVVTFEVMTDEVNRAWWRNYKKQLEETFVQEAILIRKMHIEIL